MNDTSTTKTSRPARKKETPEQRRRKKVTQIGSGVLVFIVICLVASIAQNSNPKGAFVVLIGAGLGYVLQRSRFCFTASLRDPVLTGGTNLTKAVIIALATISFIFMALNMSRFGLNLESVDIKQAAGHIKPVGIHTALGAFIFGIGAVIAGGCASGTLMRMGEGFMQQWLVFVFFVIGSILGLALADIIIPKDAKAVFLPELTGGWLPAIVIQFGMLFILYIVADIWGKKSSRRAN